MKRMRRFILFILLLPPLCAAAQKPLALPTLGLEMAFNFGDFMAHNTLGVESPRFSSSLQAGFGYRFGSKKVLIQQEENLFYQYRERRYLLFLAAEKRVEVLEFGENLSLHGFAFVRGVFTFGDFRGTTVNPEASLLPVPGAGLALRFPYGIARLGYQYMKLETGNISPHRIILGCNFIFSDSW